MKGVLFHQDNAPARKTVVAMTAVHDCGFELVDHSIFSRFGTIWLFSVPQYQKSLGWEAVSDRWWSHICSWELFRESGWELLYGHWNPSAATPMEEVCGPQGETNLKITTFEQIRPLHHTCSQPMNFSAHPHICSVNTCMNTALLWQKDSLSDITFWNAWVMWMFSYLIPMM